MANYLQRIQENPMRKIMVQTFLSLDGVMQGPGAPDEDTDGGFDLGGWSVNYWDEAMMAAMGEAMQVEYDLLLGRRTYDIFRAHWPNANDDFMTPRFNRVTKYVLTHHADTATWENTVALGPDPVAHLKAIKAEDGRDLSVSGSSELVQVLLAHGLVDKLDLWTFPVLLGKGKKLFGTGTTPAGLSLDGTVVSSSGCIIARYVAAEQKAAGSFGLQK
jgi:dihydrofolate reductase